MTSPRIVGLDLSLTSTGWATVQGGLIETGRFTSKPPTDTKVRSLAWYRSSFDRIGRLMLQVGGLAESYDLAVVEGPSLGAKGSGVDRMYGMWWLVLGALSQRGVPYAVVAPSCMKRYMTGSGGAGKDAVLAAVIRRLPGEVNGNDEADALALAAMGADHLGCPLAAMPQTHRAALSVVEWPELAVPAVA